MAFKYQITDKDGVYFLTTSVVNWIDVFTRKELADVVIDSLIYCQKTKGLVLYAWCLMPSHLHLIAAARENFHLSDIMRDFKKFTSKKLIKTIQEINESRKDWLLDKFEFAGKWNPKIEGFKFWQDGYHPILLESNYFTEQKLEYVHQNPVKAGLVFEPFHYRYSSAIDYYTENEKGLIDVFFIE